MRSLRGTIYSMSVDNVPKGSVLKLYVFDATHQLKPSNATSKTTAKMLGRKEIQNISSFPIEYVIDYQDLPYDSKEIWYFLLVRIENNGQTIYSNETGDTIAKNSKIRKNIDVFLKYYPTNE
jgi:uncharacterized lipoprotein YbaY